MRITILVLTVLALSSGLAVPLLGQEPPFFEPGVEPVAFTAIGIQTVPGASVHMTEVAYRRDGSFRETKTAMAPGHPQRMLATIWNMESGNRTELDVTAKVITGSFSFDVGDAIPYRSRCLNKPVVGTMLGYKVVEGISTSDKVDVRSLSAPELNCLVMRVDFGMKGPDGSVMGTNRYEVHHVKLGEPDPSLFAVPDDFSEKRFEGYVEQP